MKRKDLIPGMRVGIFHAFNSERRVKFMTVESPDPYKMVGAKRVRTNVGQGVLVRDEDDVLHIVALNKLYTERDALTVASTYTLLES